MMKKHHIYAPIGGILLTAIIAACGSTAPSNAAPAVGALPKAAPAPAIPSVQPIIIENMDETLVFAAPPQRAVTLSHHVTEVMLALGLDEVLVGMDYNESTALPELNAAYERAAVHAQIFTSGANYPAREVLFDLAPDFVYAGYPSAFKEKAFGARSELARLGIQTYLQESSAEISPTLDDVFRDILNIGRIFRIEDRAEQFVAAQRQEIQSIQQQVSHHGAPLRVFVYDSGDDRAMAAANTFVSRLLELIGGQNIFSEIEKRYAEVSWEEVVSRNPEVIVILDYGNTTAEQKQTLLMGKTALAGVSAIKNKRFVTLPLNTTAGGVRTPSALRMLADGLYSPSPAN